MNKNFYITTPIYYPSASPHIGHAYSSIIADFFSRFKKIDGYKVYFLTGTDEHGLKIQRAAEKQNKDPKSFCDEISKTFENLTETLNLSNTDFIRTTEDRHKISVQNLCPFFCWIVCVSEFSFVSNETITANFAKLSLTTVCKY